MKLIGLQIEGFLSYKQQVTIDFREFDLACITGENGAGKSSILDAMTWALFGKARQSNESLINLQSDTAQVCLTFEYNNESYKVKRSNQRGKSMRLTFATKEVDLTERTIRDTQKKIERILMIDYDTFIQAVFFLQGQPDQFVTATPGQRKQVLFEILGLEQWEAYRLNAQNKIKGLETELAQLQGQQEEVRNAVAVEKDVRVELEERAGSLKVTEEAIKNHEAQVSRIQEAIKGYEVWQQLSEDLNLAYLKSRERVKKIGDRTEQLNKQRTTYTSLVLREKDIIKDYDRHQELLGILATLTAQRVEYDQVVRNIETWEKENKGIAAGLLEIPGIEGKIKHLKDKQKITINIEEELDEAKKEQIEIYSRQTVLDSQISEQSKQVSQLEGRGTCSTCNQKIKDPAKHISELKKIMDANVKERDGLLDRMKELTPVINGGAAKLRNQEQYAGDIRFHEEVIKKIREEADGFDHELLLALHNKRDGIQYDQEEHSVLVEEKNVLSVTADREMGQLETAKQALGTLENQMEILDDERKEANTEEIKCLTELQNFQGKERYDSDFIITQQGQLNGAHSMLGSEVKRRDETNQRIGLLEGKLQTIEENKERLNEIKEKEAENKSLHQKFSTLQEAFSKKGVPALLVEQSLPQIEDKANQLLARLSEGQMAVHFVTQKAYSDATRDDMQETLDIEIQDQEGIRDYEMYSGGESFRINFAIRIGLSHVLANRSGAQLRTLVIDEGFGSQDAAGRDRLINAINAVKPDYDKVLVITHIPEVIEAFPVQLRVEKTSAGSTVRLL